MVCSAFHADDLLYVKNVEVVTECLTDYILWSMKHHSRRRVLYGNAVLCLCRVAKPG